MESFPLKMVKPAMMETFWMGTVVQDRVKLNICGTALKMKISNPIVNQ
jgi:hypothetical protein